MYTVDSIIAEFEANHPDEELLDWVAAYSDARMLRALKAMRENDLTVEQLENHLRESLAWWIGG